MCAASCHSVLVVLALQYADATLLLGTDELHQDWLVVLGKQMVIELGRQALHRLQSKALHWYCC